MESSRIKNNAAWLSAISGIAFFIGLGCGVIGFFLDGKDAALTWEIGVGLLAISFWALFWAQFAHIRGGIERTNELLEYMVSVQSNASAAAAESQKAQSASPATPKVVPPSKEHTEWLLACAQADREGLPRPAKPS